jgi:hypothetical protein
MKTIIKAFFLLITISTISGCGESEVESSDRPSSVAAPESDQIDSDVLSGTILGAFESLEPALNSSTKANSALMQTWSLELHGPCFGLATNVAVAQAKGNVPLNLGDDVTTAWAMMWWAGVRYRTLMLERGVSDDLLDNGDYIREIHQGGDAAAARYKPMCLNWLQNFSAKLNEE